MLPDRREDHVVLTAARIAERLIAHARLCRHIAEESWNEDTARQLDTLALECERAAAELAPTDRSKMQ